MESNVQKNNLFKALGDFIEAMRKYIAAFLLPSAPGGKWAGLYRDSLSAVQQGHWDAAVAQGAQPETLIDFNNLKGFALKYKHLLKADFGNDVNNLPTWFYEIYDVRNKCNHYQELEDLDYQRAFNNMIKISRKLKMTDLEDKVAKLRDNRAAAPVESVQDASPGSLVTPWFSIVTPHIDIRQGILDESVYAADLSEVALDQGREIYRNPSQYFEKTYFTEGFKTISRRVIQGLNGGTAGENRVITLQTGFGGGKTHALIGIYHLAKHGQPLFHTIKFPDDFAVPHYKKANTAVFTNKTCDPTQGRIMDDGTHVRTLWGELAYQLGGKEAYEVIAENDRMRTAPKGLIRQVLEKTSPCLILIDELTDYCVTAAGVMVGNSSLADQTVSFIQDLSESVAQVDGCVMVATLPASDSEVGSKRESINILKSLSNRLSRVSADTKPVADEEIYEVIRLRLFEQKADSKTIDAVVSAYTALYNEVSDDIPKMALRSEYKKKMVKCYPFHPQLIDMFRYRWASHHDFQRTRGILRILAAIVSDLWKRRNSLVGTHSLIHTSDVNVYNLDALREQIKKLYSNGYQAVMDTDIAGSSSNAVRIDSDKKEYRQYNICQGVAGTILLGSFGSSDAKKGIELEEIKLCVLKPQSFNHNLVNGVLYQMESSAHYLYYSSTASLSKRYWFFTNPNINILINQAKNEVQTDAQHAEIIRQIEKRARRINRFKVLVNPNDDIPEQKSPTLIILSPHYASAPGGLHQKLTPYIEKLATKKGNSERIYRNTMLFLAATEAGLLKLYHSVSEYLACKKIIEDYKSNMEAAQLSDLQAKITEIEAQLERDIVSAYSFVVKYVAREGLQKLVVSGASDTLDTQVDNFTFKALKDEEWLLEGVGMGILRSNGLLPEPGKPVRALDVYEAFIRFDDKPMVTGSEAVENSLKRYYQTGEYCIGVGGPLEFEPIYYKDAVPGFDVLDERYWLLDKSMVRPAGEETAPGSTEGITPVEIITSPRPHQPGPVTVSPRKTYKNITISGNVDILQFRHIFSGLVMPLNKNHVEIEIKVTAKSTSVNPIAEGTEEYEIPRETASQLGLDFKTEEE